MMVQASLRQLAFAALASAALTFFGTDGARAQSAYAIEMSAGREAYDGSNFQLAERHFKGALEAAGSPGQQATALYSLAVVAQRQGKIDEAKDRAKKALDLAPKHSSAKYLLEELDNTKEPEKPRTRTAAAKSKQKDEAPAPEKPVKAKEKVKEQTASDEAAPKTKPQLAKKSEDKPEKKNAAAVASDKKDAGTSREKDAVKAAVARAPKAEPAKASPQRFTLDLTTTLPPQAAPILAADFARNDKEITLIVGLGEKGSPSERTIELRRFLLPSGNPGDVYTLHPEVARSLVAMSSDGRLTVTAVPGGEEAKSSDRSVSATIHLWDNETVENTHAIEMTVSSDGKSPLGVLAAAFTRDGKRLAIVHRTGIEILDTDGLRGAAAYRFSPRQRVRNSEAPLSVAISANGRRTVLTNGSRLRLIEGKSVKDVGRAKGEEPFSVVALSDDGEVAAAAQGGRVLLMDPETGKELATVPELNEDVTAMAFSPDGKHLAIASPTLIRVWSVPGKTIVGEANRAAAVSRLGFSSDGTSLLASGPAGGWVWHLTPEGAVMAQKDGATTSAVTTASVSREAAEKQAADAAKAAAEKAAAEKAAAEKARLAARAESEAQQAREREAERKAEEARKAEDARRAEEARKADEASKAADAAQRALQQEAQRRAEAEQAKKTAEQAAQNDRAQLVAAYKDALSNLDCAKAQSLAAKLEIADDAGLATCRHQAVLKNGSARELFLAAAVRYSDQKLEEATELYKALMKRFPQDDLALKAAERLMAITDRLEAVKDDEKSR